MAEKICELVKNGGGMQGNYVVDTPIKIGTYDNGTKFNMYRVWIQEAGKGAGTTGVLHDMTGIMTSNDYVISITGTYIINGSTGYFPINASHDGTNAFRFTVWYTKSTNSLSYLNASSERTESEFIEVTFISRN